MMNGLHLVVALVAAVALISAVALVFVEAEPGNLYSLESQGPKKNELVRCTAGQTDRQCQVLKLEPKKNNSTR